MVIFHICLLEALCNCVLEVCCHNKQISGDFVSTFFLVPIWGECNDTLMDREWKIKMEALGRFFLNNYKTSSCVMPNLLNKRWTQSVTNWTRVGNFLFCEQAKGLGQISSTIHQWIRRVLISRIRVVKKFHQMNTRLGQNVKFCFFCILSRGNVFGWSKSTLEWSKKINSFLFF